MASTGIRRSRPSPAVAATVVAGIVGTLAAGCATVPSSTAPREVLTDPNAVQAYVRPLPPPPPSSKLYTSAQETVLGFLSASAAYAYDPAAARQFLSPNLRENWRPGPVTVVALGPTTTQSSSSAQASTCRGRATCVQFSARKPASPLQYATVKITAQHLATLSSGGQYEYSAGTSKYTFRLAEIKKHVWQIVTLPQGPPSLLLTKASFQEVYQPRNLFFWAHPQASVVNGAQELVPDPVYAPLQSANNALNTDVAAGLINGLFSDRNSWLNDATTTAFPPGTALLKVTLRGQTAIVDLGGTAKSASGPRIDQMQQQLQATLANKAYSSPLVHTVVLEIDGRTPFQGSDPNLVSPVVRGQLIYQSGPDTVSDQDGRLAGPGQIGSAQITALASAQGGALAVAVQSRGGCEVYVPATRRSVGPYHPGRIPDSTGPCTSLSWDRNGNLWAVAGGRIWLMMPRTHYRWLTVSSPPKVPSDGKSGPDVLSMQMAPDGVRAALLVQEPGGNRVMMLAAVVVTPTEPKIVNGKGPNGVNVNGGVSLGTAVPAWAGLSRPIALSWYSAYDLVVLTRTGVWQVPLTGGAGRMLAAAPAGAVSLASNGADLAVGTSDHGQYALEQTSGGSNHWNSVAPGFVPFYPTYSTYQPPSG